MIIMSIQDKKNYLLSTTAHYDQESESIQDRKPHCMAIKSTLNQIFSSVLITTHDAMRDGGQSPV